MRHARCGLSVTALLRRGDSLFSGAIQARMGSWITGMACRVPEIVSRAILRVTSSFLT